MNRSAVVVNLVLSFLLIDGVAHSVEASDAQKSAIETSDVAEQRTQESSRRVKQTIDGRDGATFPAAVAMTRRGQTMPARPGQIAEENAGWVLLARRAVVAIVLSGGLAVALLLAIGKSSRKVTGKGAGEGLEVLATLSLAPRCAISLIRARDQTVLVARDASGVKQMILLANGFDTYLGKEVASSSLSPSLMQPRQQ